MKRDVNKLASKTYDLVIIGGGIFGVCAAWEATLQGLSVAIVDKGDFSHATSANHFKMVHGGIRYLQHGDVVRIRESSRERSALLRTAPHLVKPLPIVIPTYGHGMQGKQVLRVGMLIYDLLTMERNRGLKRERQIPWGKFISRDQVLNLFPGIRQDGLTGAAVFCDGQMYNPPRIALSFLRSAMELGALAANYVEATGFLRDGNRVLGIKANDILENRSFQIHGRFVLNTAGPWAQRLLEANLDLRLSHEPTFSRDLAFVVNRAPMHRYAIAFSTGSKDSDTFVDRGGRHLFAVPWRDYMLIGVWHKFYTASPDEIIVEPDEIESFVNEVNQAYPGIGIRLDEITLINTGLILFGEDSHQSAKSISFGKRSMLIDHENEHGLKGVATLIGVRATTARGMAEKAIDLIMKRLKMTGHKAKKDILKIRGGNIDSFETFLEEAIAINSSVLSEKHIKSLVHNYGDSYASVLQYIDENSQWLEPVGQTATIKAQIVHAIREEMAMKYEDIVMRRTDLATGEIPDLYTLKSGLKVMSTELGWNQDREEEELHSTLQTLRKSMFKKLN